jgi:hypothetical protein
MNCTFKLILYGVLSTFSCLAAASNDGEVDQESTGTIQISLSIQPSIRIDIVDDIRLNIVDRNVDTNFSEYLCITGNFGGKYQLIAYGSNDSSDNFTLTNTQGEELAYYVAYRGNKRQSQFDTLSPGTPSPVYDLVMDQSSCSDQHSFKITFRSQHLNQVESGLYTGYLTLLVSPV